MIQHFNKIKTLLSDVATASTVLNGRAFMSNKYGAQEINFDSITELITDAVGYIKKYPLCVMPPPHSYSTLSRQNSWERYRVTLIFCDTTFYNNSTISKQNPSTKTSTEPVEDIWDRMRDESKRFLQSLQIVQFNNPSFRIVSSVQALTTPFSNVGVDRVSGIKVVFEIELFNECDFTYDKNLLNAITI